MNNVLPKYSFDCDVVEDINGIIDERIKYLQDTKSEELLEQNREFVAILQSIFNKFSAIDTDDMDYKEVIGIYKGINLCIRAIDEFLADRGNDAA